MSEAHVEDTIDASVPGSTTRPRKACGWSWWTTARPTRPGRDPRQRGPAPAPGRHPVLPQPRQARGDGRRRTRRRRCRPGRLRRLRPPSSSRRRCASWSSPFVGDRTGRVAAVTGQADVQNPGTNLLTRLQQVRYFAAFRVIKAAESRYGAVTCASGCFSAYRRSDLLHVLPEWENQRFLGQEATFGDDRALTNALLRRGLQVRYQSTAVSATLVPGPVAGLPAPAAALEEVLAARDPLRRPVRPGGGTARVVRGVRQRRLPAPRSARRPAPAGDPPGVPRRLALALPDRPAGRRRPLRAPARRREAQPALVGRHRLRVRLLGGDRAGRSTGRC